VNGSDSIPPDAVRFLQALDPRPGAKFTFQTLDDAKLGRVHLLRILYGTLEEHYTVLAALNDAGAGVFVAINECDGAGRKSENVVRVRALYADCDGSPIKPLIETLKPHILTETSPGKHHIIYLVSGCPLEHFTAYQKEIAQRFGSDPNVMGLPGVIRVPGFYHRKQPNAPFCSGLISMSDDAPYTVAQITASLGLVHEALSSANSSPNGPKPFELPPKIRERARHDTLMRFACSLRDKGTTEREILATLRESNQLRCEPPLHEGGTCRTRC
jgi:hypothetical protein